MELKDVILSTLAEMEDTNVIETDTTISAPKPIKSTLVKAKPLEKAVEEKIEELQEMSENKPLETQEDEFEQTTTDELQFLTSMRERMLVLFEGFQAPNNTNIEAKVDMTLNFLEYVLVTTDERISNIKKGQSNGSI